MQGPTFTGLKIRTPHDAHVLFHAVWLEKLPMVRRRLDNEERRRISPGCVYVWEEKSAHSQSGIERWTDSVRWGPSRCRDEFLFYQEKDANNDQGDVDASDSDPSLTPSSYYNYGGREHLVKQTYSVFVNSPRGRRKWHMIAYFTQETLPSLKTIDEVQFLSQILVPEGLYKSARSAKGRAPRERIDTFAAKNANSHSVALFPRSSVLLRTLPKDEDASSQKSRQALAPLTYLQSAPPHRRHPVDEEALMAFTPGLLV